MIFLKRGISLNTVRKIENRLCLLSTQVQGTIDNEETKKRPKTGILMMNMGGPKDGDEVNSFLKNLFSDRDLFKIPFQDKLGSWIARRRTPMIREAYGEIGGGSPIHKWTHLQGEGMVEILDQISPQTGPHKYYVGFRYVSPYTEEAIEAMERDGLERAVAFSQYPHYSCSTTGSSLNALWRHYRDRDWPSHMAWSVIDRWPTHPALVNSFADSIKEKLSTFPADVRDDVVILFTAHSLPQKYVMKGDSYPYEVAATVQAVMDQLGHTHSHVLTWQSKVGLLPWLSPSTKDKMKSLETSGFKGILLVPISFTSDHIETLYELDIEYAEILSYNNSMIVKRAESMNDRPSFIKGLADLVKQHLESGECCSRKLKIMCDYCPTDACAHAKKFFRTQKDNMDAQDQKKKMIVS